MDNRCEEMRKAGLAIRIRGLKKEYRLGQIGSTTLQREIKRWWARKRGLEDPYSIIGQPKRIEGDRFMALNGVDLTIQPDNCKVYNMSGQYVGNSLNGLGKGMYIVNGKKYVVK